MGELTGLQIFESLSLLQSSSTYRAPPPSSALCRDYLTEASLDVGIFSNSQARKLGYLGLSDMPGGTQLLSGGTERFKSSPGHS